MGAKGAYPRAVYGSDVDVPYHQHDDAAAATSPRPNDHKIGVLSLAALIFFSVSGGPYGMEEAIQTAGPFVTMLALIVLPLVWSVPEGQSRLYRPAHQPQLPRLIKSIVPI